MIQRIQSLYLLLASLLSILFGVSRMMAFTDASGRGIEVKLKGIYRFVINSVPEYIGSILPLEGLLLLVTLSSLTAIFIFRNRKLQKKLVVAAMYLMVLVILVLAGYTIFIVQNYDVTLIWNIRMIQPLLIFALLLLAYRGIKKDEDLVKSYDRLR